MPTTATALYMNSRISKLAWLMLSMLLAALAGSQLHAQTLELEEVQPPAPDIAPAVVGQNILLIIADDVGVDNVTCYQAGAAPPPTPNIDTLARTGVMFRNAWANPTCSATRAGIHTGRYSFRTGVGWVATPFGDEEILSLDEVTLPEIVGPGGYACGLIGKWHLGNRTTGGKAAPLRHGWHYHSGTMWHSLAPRRNYYRWPRTVNGKTDICRTYATTQTTDDAIAWIRCQRQPWFCYVSYNAAHKPFHAPPDHLHSYDLRGLSPNRDPLPHYLATVQAMDTEIGRLLCSISDQLDNTTVIFIGDNGTPEEVVLPPCTPEHAKFSPYQGGIHVPMIISGVGVTSPGRETRGMVHTVDLFATILELTGHSLAEVAAPCRPIDSVSMVPYMVDPQQKSIRQTMYSETFRGHDICDGSCAIRNWRYKLICEGGCHGTHEFYDLWEDPHETCDLLHSGELSPEAEQAYQDLLTECTGLRSGSPAYAQGSWPYLTGEVADAEMPEE